MNSKRKLGDVYYEKHTVVGISKRTGEASETEVEEINAISIPKGATNGDMIKNMFPDFHVVEIAGDTVVLHRYNPFCKMQFDKTWWNAPYKVESEE